MGKTVYLNTPIEADQIRQLELDDVVYLSGTVYVMMFDNQFEKLMEPIRRGEPSPLDLDGGVIYHTGTIYHKKEDGTYDFRAIGATTSMKFNRQTPEIIRKTGVRVIIGKGGMNREVLSAMEECGCVYLSVVGGCSAIYTPHVQDITKEIWPQKSWSKNVLELKLDQFGPMFVAMDAHGNSVFEKVGNAAETNRGEIYRKLRIAK